MSTPKDVVDILLKQYSEVYESWRQHERFIWQLPSVVVAIDSAIFAAVFGAVFAGVPLEAAPRLVILGIGLMLTIAVFVTLVKHAYFSLIEQGTLTEIEKRLQKIALIEGTAGSVVKHIQRTTRPILDNAEYYYPASPDSAQRLRGVPILSTLNWIHEYSAHVFLAYTVFMIAIMMGFTFFVQLFLISPVTGAISALAVIAVMVPWRKWISRYRQP